MGPVRPIPLADGSAEFAPSASRSDRDRAIDKSGKAISIEECLFENHINQKERRMYTHNKICRVGTFIDDTNQFVVVVVHGRLSEEASVELLE